MQSPNGRPAGRTLRVAGPAAAEFLRGGLPAAGETRVAVPVLELSALSCHVQRILAALLQGAGRRNGYGPLDWHWDAERGCYVARADWHRTARLPDDETLARAEWGSDLQSWAPITAACSTGAALGAAMFTGAGPASREKTGGSLSVALKGDPKKGTPPDPWLAPRARYTASGSRAWWRTWTWRRLAHAGLPTFVVPAGEEQPLWGLAVYSGHVVTWVDCDRLHVVDPRTGVRCSGVWVLAWDGSYWDEVQVPGKGWTVAGKSLREKAKAKGWPERRRYRYQPTRWESVATRAEREPRVTTKTFCLVGLAAPDPVPADLPFIVEPKAA